MPRRKTTVSGPFAHHAVVTTLTNLLGETGAYRGLPISLHAIPLEHWPEGGHVDVRVQFGEPESQAQREAMAEMRRNLPIVYAHHLDRVGKNGASEVIGLDGRAENVLTELEGSQAVTFRIRPVAIRTGRPLMSGYNELSRSLTKALKRALPHMQAAITNRRPN